MKDKSKKNDHVEFVKLLVKKGYKIYRLYQSQYMSTMFGPGMCQCIHMLHPKLSPICYEIPFAEIRNPKHLNELQELAHKNQSV